MGDRHGVSDIAKNGSFSYEEAVSTAEKYLVPGTLIDSLYSIYICWLIILGCANPNVLGLCTAFLYK